MSAWDGGRRKEVAWKNQDEDKTRCSQTVSAHEEWKDQEGTSVPQPSSDFQIAKAETAPAPADYGQ